MEKKPTPRAVALLPVAVFLVRIWCWALFWSMC